MNTDGASRGEVGWFLVMGGLICGLNGNWICGSFL